MLDAGKLRRCIEGAGGLDDRSIARKLAHVAEKIGALEHECRTIIKQYGAEQLSGQDYIAANRVLDREQERLTRKKAELVAAMRSPRHEDFVDASLRQFCANANARVGIRCAGMRRRRHDCLVIHCSIARWLFNSRYGRRLVISRGYGRS
jgi:hypothetical protein